MPCLIAADWYMRNPDKNPTVYTVPRLSFVFSRWAGSPSQTSDVTSPRTISSRSLIITTNQTSRIPAPSQRVRLCRQAGLSTYPDDYPNKEFFGYEPTGYSEDEGEALLSVTLLRLLLCLRKRPRRWRRWWWRLRQQKRL